MIQRKSFLIDTRVHDRLKAQAKKSGLTIGGQIRRLVDAADGKPNHKTKEYRNWLRAVCRVGRLNGEKAAEQFIEDNPAPNLPAYLYKKEVA